MLDLVTTDCWAASVELNQLITIQLLITSVSDQSKTEKTLAAAQLSN